MTAPAADHRRRTARPAGPGVRLIVRAPHRHRGTVAQQVDCLPGLPAGLVGHAAAHKATDRQVLPHQHAQLVGRVVQLGPGDVGDRPHQVEPGVAGGPDVVGHLRCRGRAQQRPGGQQVGALDEQPLTVDVQHPAAHGHRPEPDAEVPPVVDLGARQRLHHQIAEMLVAQRVGPPQRGIVDVDGPLHPVLPLGGMVAVDVLGAGHPGAQIHRTAAGHVQHRSQLKPGPRLVPALAGADLGADGPGVADGDPSRGPQPDRPPHAAHDQVVDPAQLGILQRPGEQGPVVGVAEAAAGGLDGQQVLGPGGELLGHLQLVGHEVPVGVAQIGAVEPDIPLLGQPLEPQPPAPAAALDGIVSPGASVPDGGCGLAPGRILGPGCDRLRRSLEAVAVQHRLLDGQVRARAVRPAACAQWPGTGIVVQRESSWSSSWNVRRRPFGGRSDPPRPAQVHRPKLPPAVAVPRRLMRPAVMRPAVMRPAGGRLAVRCDLSRPEPLAGRAG